jgi:hypothetical protein
MVVVAVMMMAMLRRRRRTTTKVMMMVMMMNQVKVYLKIVLFQSRFLVDGFDEHLTWDLLLAHAFRNLADN